jgi:hypothetical protein
MEAHTKVLSLAPEHAEAHFLPGRVQIYQSRGPRQLAGVHSGIARFRLGALSDNPVYLREREL